MTRSTRLCIRLFREHTGSLSAMCLCAWAALAPAWAQTPAQASAVPALPPLIQPNSQLNPDWRFVGFPQQHTPLPPTRFEAGAVDGVAALRVDTQLSYGSLVYRWPKLQPVQIEQGGPASRLTWRWRVDRPLSGGTAPANLLVKGGDDAALKLCVMFEHPLTQVPFVERTLLRMARGMSSEPLPAATLCYIWDPTLIPGTTGVNPYTRRVRFVTLGGPAAVPGQWSSESRDVAADFRRLFADELGTDPAAAAPPMAAIVIGADSDNTGSSSTAWMSHVAWDLPRR